ncbi:hypothetical protein CBR_g23591 [Chara braunii]|uniref:Uncharacterized protein n=1 Tax=Chara braunii TaxID=69332 RepID=A0A388L4Z1_CHABU|nr:hypothetical protein CBR_g23591 [Chara braunii]|eukprot:GBG77263.1 hypothetical protein CBR_g23591 [Chara braunii]
MEPEESVQQAQDARAQVPGNYQLEEDRVKEMIRACYEEGILPTNIDSGKMSVEGREAKFVLNSAVDEIKVKWLKARTVTVIFRDGARFLPKKVKEDLIRAYEDVWIRDETFGEGFKRGRIKVESPNIVLYIPRSQAITDWMLAKRSDFIDLSNTTYRTEFKPWMTRVEVRDWRRTVDESIFWVVAVGIPLDEMTFIYVHIERAIGKIIKHHQPEADESNPKLVNLRFDLDHAAKSNMKDKVWVQTHQGDLLEVRMASTESEWCRRCCTFFHLEENCRRPDGRNRGGTSSRPQQASTAPGTGVSPQPQYQGPLRAPGASVTPVVKSASNRQAASSSAPNSNMQAVVQPVLPPGATSQFNPVFSPGAGQILQGTVSQNLAPGQVNPWAAFFQNLSMHPFIWQQTQGLAPLDASLTGSPSFVNLQTYPPWTQAPGGPGGQGSSGMSGGQGFNNAGSLPSRAAALGPSGSRLRGMSPCKQRRVSGTSGVDIQVDEVRAESSKVSSEGLRMDSRNGGKAAWASATELRKLPCMVEAGAIDNCPSQVPSKAVQVGVADRTGKGSGYPLCADAFIVGPGNSPTGGAGLCTSAVATMPGGFASSQPSQSKSRPKSDGHIRRGEDSIPVGRPPNRENENETTATIGDLNAPLEGQDVSHSASVGAGEGGGQTDPGIGHNGRDIGLDGVASQDESNVRGGGRGSDTHVGGDVGGSGEMR